MARLLAGSDLSVVVVETFPTRIDRAARRTVHRYRVAVACHRGWDVRSSSTVSHRVPMPAVDVLARLCAHDQVTVDLGFVALHADATAVGYDSFEHEHRLRADVRMPWSWPALPMWLAVAEASAATSSLRLSLRSRRRLRYPLRYFDAAHRLLDSVAELIDIESFDLYRLWRATP